MTISFPPAETWNGNRDIVLFPANVNGKTVQCAVSWEALQDNYGGNGVPPLDCFRENRKAIEAKAERLIQKGRFEPDGSLLIRSQDGP